MSLIMKTYIELLGNFKFILQTNIAILQNDMKISPSFDPTHDYEEKNQYINNANQIGLNFMMDRYPQFAEIYYTALLTEILEFEKYKSKKFNKGIIYANLGVAQMANNKFDQGIANLLKAHEEDKDFIGTSHDLELFKTSLYKQFEDNYIDMMHKDLEYFGNQNGITISKTDVDKLFLSLKIENRLFLVTIIREMKKNLEILKKNENIFTRTLLFSNIKNLCLFIEDFMKNILMKNGKTPSNQDLYNYINCTFKAEPWWAKFQSEWNLTKSANIQDFEKKLEKISKKTNNNHKRLLYLGCIRNFSGHHFDVSSSFLFLNFENIYKNILGIIYWIFCSFP